MNIVHRLCRLNPTGQLTVVLGLLLLSGALLSCARRTSPPVIYPATGAPLTAAIDGKTLLITNNSDQTIYHRIFPTDILPVIEWAPCLAPEVCPAEQTIHPGEQQRIALKSITRDATESITVFWWIYLDKLPGASIPPMEMKEFELPLP